MLQLLRVAVMLQHKFSYHDWTYKLNFFGVMSSLYVFDENEKICYYDETLHV